MSALEEGHHSGAHLIGSEGDPGIGCELGEGGEGFKTNVGPLTPALSHVGEREMIKKSTHKFFGGDLAFGVGFLEAVDLNERSRVETARETVDVGLDLLQIGDQFFAIGV